MGEKKELVDTYLKLYKTAPDPRARQKQSEEKRLAAEEFVRKNLRKIPILGDWFLALLSRAQSYAQIRNSRPFYYQGNQIMRTVLLIIASKNGFPRNQGDIFFLRFEELEQLTDQNAQDKKLSRLIEQRKNDYSRQSEKEPRFEVKV